MTTANVYLNFNGNCEDAFNFYKSVFGGEFSYVGRFKDMPQEGGSATQAVDGEKIMHMGLPLANGSALMGSDTGGQWAPGYVQGNNFSISLNTDSKEETDRLFNGLSKDGQVTVPMNKTFWGDYFGMCKDKFGINWMFSFNEN